MAYSESASIAPFRLTANVTRTVLDNGLTVLIKENHTAPVVSLLVSVQVGYFNEPDRWNGLAHVVEHMLFKGTPRRPENEQIARDIRQLGGIVNAATYYEETYYYVLVPSRHLEQAMEIQADAFQNSLFDADELAKEIEVIVQESMQKRDNPNAMLVESLYATAYDSHRIRRWRMGMPDTLRAFRREDLVDFVAETYRPENITLTIVGDITTAEAQRLAEVYWANVPRATLRKEMSPLDAPRSEFRYRRMTGDTQQRLLIFGLPTPPILHEDAPALMVLGALLSDGRSARLYRKLKEELRLVNSAWASYEGFKDIGVFTLGAESIADDTLPAERALWAEIAHIQQEPVAAEELTRIKTRVETRRLFAQEEVMGMARTLANYENLGDYRLSDTLIERLRAVTAEDVRRVANVYINLPQATLVEYLPSTLPLPPEETPKQRLEALTVETQALLPPRTIPASASASDATTPPRTIPAQQTDIAEPVALTLPQGGQLYFRARRDLPIVAIQIYFRGGRRNEQKANCGITNLMLKSALKGTVSFTAEEIASRIEGLGSGIGQALGMDNFGFGIKLRRDALEEGFRIFAEVIAQPIFPEQEVDREKQAIYAEIRRQQDNNFSLAYDLFSAACYGEQPYGLPSNGITEALEVLTVADLQNWHRSLLTPDNLAIGIVGDITQEEALALCAQLPLPASTASSQSAIEVPTSRFEAFTERVVHRPKHQTASILAFPGAEIANPDRYALDLLSEITSGMGGRFFRSVRGDNALAYQVTSFHRSRRDAGNFVAYTSTAPENEQKARDLLLADCQRLTQEPVPADELASAKAAVFGEHVIGTQTFGAQASELAAAAVNQFPPDEPLRYLERIQTLTSEQLRDVAERYLMPDHCWLGVVRGPEPEAK